MKASFVFVLFCSLFIVGSFSQHLSLKTKKLQTYAKRAADYESFPVGGNIYPIAIYYTAIKLGTPPKEFNVALDTGSSDLIIPNVGCDGCINGAPSYDSSASSTAKKKECFFSQCKFSNTYETCDPSHPTEPCTIKGLVWRDQFQIGQYSGEVTFGSITYQTSNFEQFQAIDGVIGLAGLVGNLHGDVPALQKLYEDGVIKQNIFAMCFIGDNGTFTVGGIDPRMYHGAINYTPNVASLQYYSLHVDGMQIGTKDVPSSEASNVILDSGTNILLLPTPLFSSVQRTVESYCATRNLTGVCGNYNSGLFNRVCYPMTTEERAAFPNITINLRDGVRLSVRGDQYLLVQDTPGQYCLGIEKTGDTGFFIIGDVIIQSYYLVIDNENQRIGWADVNADACINTN